MTKETESWNADGVEGWRGSAARIEHTTPSSYRLARESNGNLVLQGAYMWADGSSSGAEWRDIPTVLYGEI